jgi:APA family basic amino acid/polyamine antiporter
MTNNDTKLRRDVTLSLLIFYGLGNIFGAGIYVLVGKIAGISSYYTPFAFILACIIVFFTALSYAELSSRYPYSAGEALYVKKAFNSNTLSFIIGLMIALSGILSSATILNGFYGYLSQFIELNKTFVSIVVCSSLCFIAIVGISKSLKVALVFTLIEIFGLAMIIFNGFIHLDFTSIQVSTLIPNFEISVWYTISIGAFLAFYAFIGFEDMVNIAEEVKNPTKTMPKAILIVLVVSTLIYILISLISILTIEPDTLSHSNAPLSDVYKTLTGQEAVILSLIGMFAVINGALIQIIMVSRLFYGMANNSWLPKIFASVNAKTNTPIFATIVATIIILIFALWLPLVTLASLTSFFIFIIFTFMNVALIKIKLQEEICEDTICIPMFVPVIGTVLNLILLAIQIHSVFTI